jgi:putative phosphoesterase
VKAFEAKTLEHGQTLLPTNIPKTEPVKIIGLISDTHIPTRAQTLPKSVFTAFEKADFILHAGDLVELSVIDELEQIAPVLAVRGNMDVGPIRELLPEVNVLKLFDWKIGLVHDPGSLTDLCWLREIASYSGFNVLVYGHTHTANITWEEQTLFINPGSAIFPEPAFTSKPTVALLKVTKQSISPEIVEI